VEVCLRGSLQGCAQQFERPSNPAIPPAHSLPAMQARKRRRATGTTSTAPRACSTSTCRCRRVCSWASRPLLRAQLRSGVTAAGGSAPLCLHHAQPATSLQPALRHTPTCAPPTPSTPYPTLLATTVSPCILSPNHTLPTSTRVPCAPHPLHPLQVGNQREVERWIDIMVFHGGVAPVAASGKAPGGGLGRGGGGVGGSRGTSRPT
jgi:hypothetical protein